MKIVINTVDWVTEPHSILARVKEEIDRNLNGHTTGTFVLTMDGPTTGENAMLVALGGSYSNSGPETTARYRLIRLPVSGVPPVLRVERTTTETPE